MKQILILSALWFCISCSSPDDAIILSEGLPQTWELIGLNTGLSGEFLEKDDLPYQESIRLGNDSTFTRSRILASNKLEVIGTFEYRFQENQEYLVLLHTEQNELIGNCLRSLEEWYAFSSATSISSGGLLCDRPGLNYERVE